MAAAAPDCGRGSALSTPDGPLNAFSVDVEDFFHVAAFAHLIRPEDWPNFETRVEDNTRRLLDLLARYDVRATMFVLGWVAERAPELVREMHAAGHELAIHGYSHQRVTELTPDQFREDVRSAKEIVEQIAGVEIEGYRAPTYSIVKETMWATDILLEEGFRYDSSIFPIRHDRYGIPDAPRFPWVVTARNGSRLVEFPISTLRLFGQNFPFVGGGYLRLLPASYVEWGMRKLNREGKPVIVYTHPWEIDPDQPRQAVGLLTRIRHYGNLRGTEGRLARLFERFRFGTVRAVLESTGDLAN